MPSMAFPLVCLGLALLGGSNGRCLDSTLYPQVYPSQSYRPKLHAAYWDTSMLLNNMVKILAEELYGYDVTLVNRPGLLVGADVLEGVKDGSWDADLEAWRVTLPMFKTYGEYATSAGAIGYPGVSGPFVTGSDLPGEFGKVLESWKSYRTPAAIDALPPSGSIPSLNSCPQAWCLGARNYTPPACLNPGARCGTYVVPAWAYLGTNAQLVRNLNLNLTITIDDDVPTLVNNYSAQNLPMLFYWWSPERIITQKQAVLLNLPPFNRQQWTTADRLDCCAPNSNIASAWDKEPLYKVVSTTLEKDAPVLSALIRTIFLGVDQIENMLSMLPADSPANFNPATANASCDWLRANTDVWEQWRPPLYCQRNHYVDAPTQSCLQCPIGRKSPPGFGRTSCRDCPAGSFGTTAGCTTCPLQFFEPDRGKTSCTKCPEYSSRSLEHCELDPTFCIPSDINQCQCREGYYKVSTGNTFGCESCPTTERAYQYSEGAVCEGGATMPYSNKGYWAAPENPLVFLTCNFGTCEKASATCYGGLSNSSTRAIPGYPKCSGSSYQEGMLTKCGDGNYGIMCANCETGMFKYGKTCVTCPPVAVGGLLYPLAPIFWILLFFPGIKLLIGDGITPSLFITLPFLQITAIIGTFGFVWPEEVKNVLSLFKVVNFDINLTFFDCWLEPSFLAKWLFIQSLPFIYAVRYLGPHYFRVWRGTFKDEKEVSESWNLAFRDTLFLANMLYIGLSNWVLMLYDCTQITETEYVLTHDPRVACHEGDHLAAVVLSVLPLVAFVIGWPLIIAAIFYTAKTRLLLNDPTYIFCFGFLYKRYEVQFYWWHVIIVGYKLGFVILKVFFLEQFMQGPLGILMVGTFIICQSYAAPFESTVLDRLMVVAQATLFIEILIGIAFCTEMGKTDMQGTLKLFLFIFLFGCLAFIGYITYSDVVRYNRRRFLAWAAQGHSCADMQPRQFTQTVLFNWVAKAEREEWELMTEFVQAFAKYQPPVHLADPILLLVKGSPELLDLVLFASSTSSVSTPVGTQLYRELERRYEADALENQAPVSLEKVDTNLKSVVTWLGRSLKHTFNSKMDDSEDTDDAEDMVLKVFKEAHWGLVFYFLCHCTQAEKVTALQTLFMLTSGEIWSKEEACARLGKEPETGSDLSGNDGRSVLKSKIDDVCPEQERSTGTEQSGEESPECSSKGSDGLASPSLQPLLESTNEASHQMSLVLQEHTNHSECQEDRRQIRHTIYQRYFDRYDIDGSNHISSEDEIEMLTINLITHQEFKAATEQLGTVALNSKIATARQEMKLEMEDTPNFGLTLAEYIHWFEANFLENKHTNLRDCKSCTVH